MGTIYRALFALGALAALGCAQGDDEQTTKIEAPLLLAPAHFDPFDPCNEPPTQCNGMHCCPPLMAMSGAHYGMNTFRCQAVAGATTNTEALCRTFAGGPQRSIEGVNVRACPSGMYMKGHHVGNNVLTCCPYPTTNRSTSWVLDGHGESANQTTDPFLNRSFFNGQCFSDTMHACPVGSVMEGVNVSANWFICGT